MTGRSLFLINVLYVVMLSIEGCSLSSQSISVESKLVSYAVCVRDSSAVLKTVFCKLKCISHLLSLVSLPVICCVKCCPHVKPCCGRDWAQKCPTRSVEIRVTGSVGNTNLITADGHLEQNNFLLSRVEFGPLSVSSCLC